MCKKEKDGRKKYKRMNRWMSEGERGGWKDGWMDEREGGGWIDGWMKEKKEDGWITAKTTTNSCCVTDSESACASCTSLCT